ncbi:hypothetical protein [Parasitella parasitica]|uniref:Uncharacterized protein n=1 Tax=Parasitella parasitica TaxID=35722 RepID=A0A0B7NL59_9FUNG|nr:hypothetical protein [Parasitella parasitica]
MQVFKKVVLKIQLKRLVDQQSERGVIYTKDLLSLIDRFEVCEHVALLTQIQKKAILPYTKSNPDLEMTPDDILNLLKLVCPPSPVVSISAPTTHIVEDLVAVRPRTSPPLKNHSSAPWKRRPSAVAASIQDRNHLPDIVTSPTEDSQQEEDDEEELHQDLVTSNNHSMKETNMNPGENEVKSKLIATEEEEEEHEEEQYSTQDLARYYRRSLKLTQRLKSSEKSLASMARDNEDRIVQLQNKVDDMNIEVAKQKREIQEYKGKEKNSLDQISALETHISNIQKSETDQKQVYLSIKTLFDEKCHETQELQNLLRQKECDLEKTEHLLDNFQYEVQLLNQERKRLIGLQSNLEMELQTSAQAHKQLEEQKSENEKLKEIIDALKTDLDEALHQQSSNSAGGDIFAFEFADDTTAIEPRPHCIKRQPSIVSVSSSLNEESHGYLKTLETEFSDSDQLKSVRDEKDYYKNRANEAKEDLDRVKSELDHLRRALDSENRSLMNELAELRLKTSTVLVPLLSPSSSSTTANELAAKPILDSVSLTIPEPPVTDVWSHSRLRKVNKRNRTVQDLHKSTSSMSTFAIATTIQNGGNHKDRRIMTRRDDKIVTNTVTFALYTVLVYFFGIVTSTFLLEGASGQNGWEQALVAAASGQVPKSKVLEIILYWLEKLLFEPQGLPVS